MGILDFSTPSETDRFMSPEEIISKLKVKQGSTVIDLGAGAGYWVMILAKKIGEYGKIYALEINPSLLDLISKKAKEEGLENVVTIHFNLDSEKKIPVREKADLVVISNMLPFLKSKDEVLKHANDILKKGGRVVVIDWDKDGIPIGPPISTRLSEEEVIKTAKKHGLVLKENIEAGMHHYGLIFTKK